MPSQEKEPKTVSVDNVRIDGETYRALSLKSYHGNVPLQSIISGMLRKCLAIEGFLSKDFDIVHREIIKTLANSVPEETLIQEARKLAMLAKEMLILNVGSKRPDVRKYIKSFTSFMEVNGYAVSVSENNEDGTIMFYAKPAICRKYSVFWAEIIRMTLESIAEVTKVEATESSVYFECRVRAP
jgi:hypothetical protein